MTEARCPAAPGALKGPASAADNVVWLGLIVGFTPVLAGLIFRTHSFHVAPGWAETLRQMDVPFLLVELFVILWARGCGMGFRAVAAQLDRSARWALAIFLGTFWISSVFIAEQPGYSAVRASFWFVHVGFGFAVFHLAGQVISNRLGGFAVALCAGLVAFLPLMAIHLLNTPDPTALPGGKIIWSSAIPGCLSVRHLGIWSALVLACAVGVLYADRWAMGYRLLACGMIFIATAVLFWSGTRAGVYGLAGAGVVLLATLRRLPPLRLLLLAFLAAALGALVSSLGLPPDNSFGLLNSDDLLPGTDPDRFSAGRIILWVGMMKAFVASPFFGTGEGSILWLLHLPGGAYHVQPHNAVVQMLGSWGIVACAAAAYLTYRVLVAVHQAARNDTAAIFVMVMVDTLLLMSLADGVLYFSRFIMWFAAGAAVVLASCPRSSAGRAADCEKKGGLALA